MEETSCVVQLPWLSLAVLFPSRSSTSLVKTNFLTHDTARSILADAKRRLKPFETVPAYGGTPGALIVNEDVTEASRIIGELFSGIP
jgi:hypothetical protein